MIQSRQSPSSEQHASTHQHMHYVNYEYHGIATFSYSYVGKYDA